MKLAQIRSPESIRTLGWPLPCMIFASTAAEGQNPANYKEHETIVFNVGSGHKNYLTLETLKHWSSSKIYFTSKENLRIPSQTYPCVNSALQDLHLFLLARIIKIELDHMYHRCTMRIKRQWSKLVQKGINVLWAWLTAEAIQRPMSNRTISLRGRFVSESLLRNSWRGFRGGQIQLKAG